MAVTRPRAQGYGVQVGADFFRVTPTPDLPMTISTRDSLAERLDQSGNPEENVLDLGYSFSRSNLTGGEGLDQWPRPPGEQQREFDSIRFWDSASLDIRRPDAGDKYSLRLSRELSAKHLVLAAGEGGLSASATHLYVCGGGNIVWQLNDVHSRTFVTSALVVLNMVHIHAGEDDTVLVVGDGPGAVFGKPAFSPEDYTSIYNPGVIGLGEAYAAWWIKGRAIVATKDPSDVTVGRVLEIAPGFSGPPTNTNADPVVTVLDTFTGTMTGCVDAGHAIVASFSDGTLRSYVPIAETAGQAPDLTVKAQVQVPHGETPFNLGFSNGVLMVLTKTLQDMDTAGDLIRAYSASVLDVRFEYAVGGLQLLRTWEEATLPPSNVIPRMTVSRDSIYFVVIEAPRHPYESQQTKPNNPTPAIWRYDVVTQGLFRQQDYLMNASAVITGNEGTTTVDNWSFVTMFQDRLVVGARGDPGFTEDRWVLWVEDVDRSLKGYLITPNITFGLNTAINWIEMILDVEDASSTARVEVLRSGDPAAILDKDHHSWTLVTIINSANQSGLEQTIVDATAHTQAIQLRLTSEDRVLNEQRPPDTAILNRFAIRGLPQHRDWIAEIPVNISDIVEAPGRIPVHVAGHGDKEYEKLINLQGKHTTCDLFDPPVQIKGIVDAVMTPVEYITKSGSQGRVSMMRFRGTRTGITSETSGTSGLGVGQLGVAQLGVDT